MSAKQTKHMWTLNDCKHPINDVYSRAAREWLPLHQRLRAMMTKEEVAQVIAYCDENKISYKQRLEELGINPWRKVRTLESSFSWYREGHPFPIQSSHHGPAAAGRKTRHRVRLQ